jgi:long-chain fatty acid transport protein
MSSVSIWQSLTVTMFLVFSIPALGSGLEFPEQGVRSVSRGGAFSAKADDPTAAAHNPGALSKLRGYHLLYNHNLNWTWSEFTRAETVIPENPSAENYVASERALEPVSNLNPFFPLGVFLAATHDFGMPDMTFGLSVYGPNSTGDIEFPVEGGQRYMLTRLEALMAYPGVSAAWGKSNFGIGATLQWVVLPKLRYSLVVDGAPGGPVSPVASSSDVEATLNLEDSGKPTAIVGAWWRPTPSIELALSGRLLPVALNAKGDITIKAIEGQTAFNVDQLTIPGSKAALAMTLPQTARLGMRYRSMEGEHEKFDIELDVVYEAWSSIDDYNVDLEGVIRLYAEAPVQDVTIAKRWRDTFSVRLGGTYAINKDLALSAGGFFEQGAAHKNYSHLDFPTHDRAGLGLGLEVGLTPRLLLTAGFGRVFQPDIEVSEAFGKVFQQRPVSQCPEGCDGFDGAPVNAGRFSWAAQTVAFGLTWRPGKTEPNAVVTPASSDEPTPQSPTPASAVLPEVEAATPAKDEPIRAEPLAEPTGPMADPVDPETL